VLKYKEDSFEMHTPKITFKYCRSLSFWALAQGLHCG